MAALNPRKHIYYLTVSDVQKVAEDSIQRRLNEEELTRVAEKVLDKIQWYDPIEESILSVTENSDATE